MEREISKRLNLENNIGLQTIPYYYEVLHYLFDKRFNVVALKNSQFFSLKKSFEFGKKYTKNETA